VTLFSVIAAGDVLLGGIAMFVFGLGLGMLFLVLAIFSTAIDKLPRSGMWMVHLKTFFAFALLAVAVYFLDFISPSYVAPVLGGVVLIIWATFTGAFDRLDGTSPGTARFARGLGLILLVLGLLLLVSGVLDFAGVSPQLAAGSSGSAAASEGHTGQIQWIHGDEALEHPDKLARERGRPVFIDFYADWCLPCKALERTVFRDREVVALLNQEFVAIKADATKPDSLAGRLLKERYKTPQMPFFAIYDRQGQLRRDLTVGKAPDREEILRLLRQALESGR
jgi:thiol:disulfide interchange protein DsbD